MSIDHDPKPHGIQLVAKNDVLTLIDTGEGPKTAFDAQPKNTPLGPMRLHGERTFWYEPDQLGLTIIRGSIELVSAQLLYNQGFFDISVYGNGVKDPVKQWKCLLQPSHDRRALVSLIDFSEDTMEPDTPDRYKFGTQLWQIVGREEEYSLFLPANRILLSRLQFTIY